MPPVKEAPKQRAISCWIEALERVAETDVRSASYLKQARAYMSEDGTVTVYFTDTFTMSMVNVPGVLNTLRASLSICLGREIAPDRLRMEYTPKPLPEEDGDAMINEILKKTEGKEI